MISNDKLEVVVPDFKPVVNFMTYNVDQAMREEKFENTKWVNRMDRVEALIKDVSPDIVCLQEMRKLPNSPTVNSWLAKFQNYYYEMGYRNPSDLSFGQCILYDPLKFYAYETVKRWLSDTPEKISDTWSTKSGGTTGYGYLVLATKFVFVSDGKVVTNSKPFWVINVHFGLEEELKTRSCYQLVDIIKGLCENEPFILAGDFNFFPDRDGNKQRDILTRSGLKDLGKGAKTLGGKSVEGTFVGFDHDDFKADLNNMISRLDHIFSRNVTADSSPILYTKTMLPEEPEELTTRNLPSDHLPIVMKLQID